MSALQEGSLLSLSPYDLDGVRTLARICGIQLSDQPTGEEIQTKLFPVWGSEKAFIENAPAVAAALKLDGNAIPDEQVLTALLATSTLDGVPLRTIRGPGHPEGSVVIIYTGAVANWMERGVREGQSYASNGLHTAGMFLIAGDRVCDKDTEVTNPFVRQYRGAHGHYPTEAQLLPFVVKELTGYEREVAVSDLNQADQIRQLITEHPELAQGRIYVPTNANATYVPLQVRRVIREEYGSFDEDGSQFWFSQDDFALATTPEQAGDTAQYQRPLTVFSGLVRLINELFLLQQL